MKKTIIFSMLVAVTTMASGQKKQEVSDDVVLSTMKKASAYMVDEVSCNGGYLWYYNEDLSQRFGEVPARKS